MTDNNTDKEKEPLLAEVLIATSCKLAQDRGIKLVELMGHHVIAMLEVFNRNVRAAQNAGDQPSEPAEGGDTVSEVASSPAEGEDKA